MSNKDVRKKIKKSTTLTSEQIKTHKAIEISPPIIAKKRRESAINNNANCFTTKLLDTKIESSKALNFFNLNECNKPENNELSLDTLKEPYNDYQECKCSSKSFPTVKSFALNTYVGIFKEINEDKVAYMEQIKRPANFTGRTWPKISYFGIFDGHGGLNCSVFLKENMLTYITEDKNFPMDIKASLLAAFEKAEEQFKLKYQPSLSESTEKSGSCALIVLVVDSKIYVANLGDSRAIMSIENGTKFKALSIDHKPNNPKEFERISKCGGKVYIDNDLTDNDLSKTTVIKSIQEFDEYCNDKEVVYRASPSDLAVTRTLGDFQNKLKELGGHPGIISSIPEIFILDNKESNDFILMGCDGIFDDLSNAELIENAWFVVRKVAKERDYDIHKISKYMCDFTIKKAMEKQSGDNLSCVIIGLEGLQKFLNYKQAKDKVSASMGGGKKASKETKESKKETKIII